MLFCIKICPEHLAKNKKYSGTPFNSPLLGKQQKGELMRQVSSNSLQLRINWANCLGELIGKVNYMEGELNGVPWINKYNLSVDC